MAHRAEDGVVLLRIHARDARAAGRPGVLGPLHRRLRVLGQRSEDYATLVEELRARRLGTALLRPGDRVRFRKRERGSWTEARVEQRERDGSVGVRDERGALRAIPVDRLQVRGTGKRGGVVWEPVRERAERDEQLGLL